LGTHIRSRESVMLTSQDNGQPRRKRAVLIVNECGFQKWK